MTSFALSDTQAAAHDQGKAGPPQEKYRYYCYSDPARPAAPTDQPKATAGSFGTAGSPPGVLLEEGGHGTCQPRPQQGPQGRPGVLMVAASQVSPAQTPAGSPMGNTGLGRPGPGGRKEVTGPASPGDSCVGSILFSRLRLRFHSMRYRVLRCKFLGYLTQFVFSPHGVRMCLALPGAA